MNRLVTVVLATLAVACLIQATQADEISNLKEFAQWLSKNGVQSHANLGKFDDLRYGAMASSDIKSGDFLVRVPSNLLITPTVISEHEITKYEDFKLSYEPLMLWLLAERNNAESFWKPYIRILPTDFTFHPFFWTDEQLALTIGTGLPDSIVERRQLLPQTFKLLADNWVLKNNLLSSFTYDDYLWAFMIVQTRAWSLDGKLTLVPLADMLNHEATAGVGNLIDVDGKGYFTINATRDYEQGAQVFDSYGARSNYDLLKSYGFVLENNPFDSATLHFNLKSSNLVQAIAEPLLRKADPNYETVVVFPNRRPDALLRLFRLSELDFKELEFIQNVLEGKPISLHNELKAYRSAISLLAQVLKSHTATVEQDNELLKSENLSAIERTAITFRRGQKLIVQNVILVLGKLWENILIEGQLPLGVPIV